MHRDIITDGEQTLS